ncbi:MAG: lipid A biosynthesis acyltransferase [Planctomycetota bacterium]|nr:MAG: lipid A biosynthesis acyltransferase [Planctomycetota bacterium]
MNIRDLRYRLEYLIFRLFACVIEVLSVRQSRAISQGVAWMVLHLLPRKMTRYRVAAENIRTALGRELPDAEVDRLIYGMWVHLVRLLIETIQLPRKLSLRNFRESVVFRDRAVAVQALCSGRPVFFLGGHFGSWELAASTFGMFGCPMGVVARKLDNPYLNKWFQASREQTGNKLYMKQGGFDGMIELAQAGGNLALLVDQDAGRRGVFVDFFGQPASTFKSIALMALEYKAILVVGYGIRLEDVPLDAPWARFEIGCEEVIDTQTIVARDEVREITQRFTTALERAIRRAPEQYFWVHRRWKTDPVTRQKSKESELRAA